MENKSVRNREILRIVGNNIRHLRDLKSWTQGDLAKAAGVSISTISQIESFQKGWTSMSLEQIANALEVDPRALFEKEYDPEELEIIQLVTRLFSSHPDGKKALKSFLKSFIED